MKNKDEQSFEKALSRLKEIVEMLEDESISLEESIRLYEEGKELSEFCNETLEKAEQRIEKVDKNRESPKNID